MANQAITAMSPEKASVLHQPGRHWLPDQRDAFIGWLRGEFAAANAIIDALCQHLHLIAPGEYDFVLGSIQQRRFSWNGVLHMQQYFSVAEVLFSLQQVTMRKQQASQIPNGKPSPKREAGRRDFSKKQQLDRTKPKNGQQQSDEYRGSKMPVPPSALEEISSVDTSPLPQQGEDTSNTSSDENPKQQEVITKDEQEVVATVEVVETGRQKMNVAEGQLYNHVLDGPKRTQLVNFATEILDKTPVGDQTCIRGKLKSSTETNDKQLQGKTPRTTQEFVKSLVDHLSETNVLSCDRRPNCFIMHVIEEGKAFSTQEQHVTVQPLYVISLLAESSLVFGKTIENVDGLFKGGSSLTLPAGSLLKLEGSSTKYAVNADPAKRILLFLGLEHPERAKSSSSTGNCSQSTAAAGGSWQARPGTGVYIPSRSNTSKCDIAMNYRACIQT